MTATAATETGSELAGHERLLWMHFEVRVGRVDAVEDSEIVDLSAVFDQGRGQSCGGERIGPRIRQQVDHATGGIGRVRLPTQ